QRDVTSWRPPQRHIHVLPAKQSVFFCWIEPLVKVREFVFRMQLEPVETLTTEQEQQLEHVINLDFDRFAMIDQNFGWVTFFDGKQRVLIFTYDPYLP